MNSDSRKFDSLRRLLALKRHEQPPPGYFNRFSRDVMVRIKAGESGTSFELALWERLLGFFDVKPVFAGAFGMAVCALLVSGVIASENPEKADNPSVATATVNNPAITAPATLAEWAPEESSQNFSPTNPVAVVPAYSGSLFDHFTQAPAEPAVDRFLVHNGN